MVCPASCVTCFRLTYCNVSSMLRRSLTSAGRQRNIMPKSENMTSKFYKILVTPYAFETKRHSSFIGTRSCCARPFLPVHSSDLGEAHAHANAHHAVRYIIKQLVRALCFQIKHNFGSTFSNRDLVLHIGPAEEDLLQQRRTLHCTLSSLSAAAQRAPGSRT